MEQPDRYSEHRAILEGGKKELRIRSADRAAVLSGVTACIFIFYAYVLTSYLPPPLLLLTLITCLLASLIAIFGDLRCISSELSPNQRLLGKFIFGVAVLAIFITFGYVMVYGISPKDAAVWEGWPLDRLLVPPGAFLVWLSVRNFGRSRIVTE